MYSVLNNEGKKGKYFHLVSWSHLSCVLRIETKKETANQTCTVTEWRYFASCGTLHVLLLCCVLLITLFCLSFGILHLLLAIKPVQCGA